MGRGGVFWVLAAVMGLACSAPAPARRPSEAMERSARILRQLDRLEADLHQGSAETTTYADLVARHGEAQQIACKVTDEHVEEIHRLAALQQEKIREKKASRKKKLVAQVSHSGRTFASR